MIFPACINLPTSSYYKSVYPHGSPILWYIELAQQRYFNSWSNKTLVLTELSVQGVQMMSGIGIL